MRTTTAAMGDGAVTVDVVRQGAARKVPVRALKAKARRVLRLMDLKDCELSVALVGDEATIKKRRLRRNRSELHPENPDFAPIIPRADECTLLGKVVEVRRYLEG